MLTTLAEKVDPRNAALIVVDWQNDFCLRNAGEGPDSNARPLDGVPEATARLHQIIAEGRKAGLPIIYIATVHGPDVDSEVWIERRRDRDHFRPLEGSWGARLHGGLTPAEDEPVVIKHRWSAFINTELEAALNARGVKSLIMAGTSANGCVEKTALDGFQLDYYVVATDCMATSHPDARSMKEVFSFGAVATADEIIACWSEAGAEKSASRTAAGQV
ncbi:MAG: isochorismatase family protein [Dehalococcoidia bacterium]|nr:isochorismatase family protein [Dehalococcoidia bacterium]